MVAMDQITEQIKTIFDELAAAGRLASGQVVVIGASTSEVMGKRIGTSGAEEVAAAIYRGICFGQDQYGFIPVFQCCEHLNRALVTERSIAGRFGWTEVSAVPVTKAGGAMAAYAYRQLEKPLLVESVQAHAGIDIGDTLIGMHLRKVAVPFRPAVRQVGQAHVTVATTRPPLIGGERAVYTL